MKRLIAILLMTKFMPLFSFELFSQSNALPQEFGITAGSFTNFPANQNYLKQDISVFYVAPYIRTGKHEFSLGILYPLNKPGLDFSDYTINSRPGFTAGYKFYIFDVTGRENLFVHYSFQYLRFSGKYDILYHGSDQPYHWTEKDSYINNSFGVGYNLFLDANERFGFYFILDYMITQTSYQLGNQYLSDKSWNTNYIWNNLSTHMGLSFKLTPLKKKGKK